MKVLVGLDRDGTINFDPGYLGRDENWRDQVRLLHGVSEGIRMLKSEGLNVVVTSNQSGVAREFFDCERVREVNDYIDSLLREEGALVDGWYSCPYVGFKYAGEKRVRKDSIWIRETDLRKPGIGMLRVACDDLRLKLEETGIYYVGDHLSDVEYGLNAGGNGVLVLIGDGKKGEDSVRRLAEKYPGRVDIADCFCSAADWIIADVQKRNGR